MFQKGGEDERGGLIRSNPFHLKFPLDIWKHFG